MEKAMNKVDLKNELFSYALDSMPGGVFIYRADEEQEILYVNDFVLNHFECKDEEEFYALTKGSFKNLVYAQDYLHVQKEIEEQTKSGNYMFDHVRYRIVTKSGKIKYLQEFGRKVNVPNVGEVYYVFILDDRLRSLQTDFDKLTGLPGKAQFISLANKRLKLCALEEEKPDMVFLYFNINKFKVLNMRYGVTKGDEVLKNVAVLLQETFIGSLVSRFADDHFVVLTENKNLVEKIREGYDRLNRMDPDVKLDGRIGGYKVTDYSVIAELACDYAKLAADSIKNHPNKVLEFYNEDISRKIEVQYYTIDHIDEAIEKKYLKIYYQPVVRSISGHLCGAEALVRWIDPEVGFLNPGDFISALEESHLIHKLDAYVVREVCREYRERVNAGKPVIPVSFNLSRLDFLLTDMFKVVEDAVNEYRVPRDMINIEITESMFVEDGDSISSVLETFHKSGYNVWMDDFGSGYSSLNVLKDFTFDELKIDMLFLSNFNERAKEILISIVRMAKLIGIQTLAEGVETKEQFEFLRTIGCEKIQGYYFGKPAPYEETIQHCLDNNMKIETITWSHYYDEVGKLNFLTEKPFALIEDDGQYLKFLFANEPYLEALRSKGTNSLAEEEENINRISTAMQVNLRTFVNRFTHSGKTEELTFPSGTQYMSVKGRNIASCKGWHMHVASLTNITINADEEIQNGYDSIARNILYLYDLAGVLDIDGNKMDIYSVTRGLDSLKQTMTEHNISEKAKAYIKNKVYPDDRDAFEKFMELETLEERIRTNSNSYIVGYFRIKEEDGNYSWHVFTVFPIPTTNYKKYLVALKKAGFEDKSVLDELLTHFDLSTNNDENIVPGLDDQNLWDNIKSYSKVNYFWKDENRKFVGVSQLFLDYYGLESQEDVIGKTDEEMNWHIHDGAFKSDEEAILKEGKHFTDVQGKCIIQGIVHNIVATKMPIYKDGKIVGIIGYFIDAERYNRKREMYEKVSIVDPVTGFANTRGVIENSLLYSEQYGNRGKDFAVINLKVDPEEVFRSTYGEDAGHELASVAAQIIFKHFGNSAAIGRTKHTQFMIFYRYNSKVEVEAMIRNVIDEIKRITRVGDFTATCYPEYHRVFASDFKNYEQMMFAIINWQKQ